MVQHHLGPPRRGGEPTRRRRWSFLVLLRVPMMRRPIFLAYHTELSMLLLPPPRLLFCCQLLSPLPASLWMSRQQEGPFYSPPPCPHTHTHPLQLLQDTNEELMEVNRCCLQREEGLRSCVRTAALPQKERGREWEGERGDRDGERKGRRERGDGRVRL